MSESVNSTKKSIHYINKKKQHLKWLRQKKLFEQFAKQGFRDASRALRTIGDIHLTQASTWETASRLLRTIEGNPYMADEIKKIMSADEVKEEITKLARSKTDDKHVKPQVKLNALEVMGRVHAIIVDRTQSENKNFNVNVDLSTVSTEDLQSILIKRLKVSAQGVIAQQSALDESMDKPDQKIEETCIDAT